MPLNVKAVLEERCQKYQEIVTFGDKQYKKRNTINNTVTTKTKKRKKDKDEDIEALKIDAIEKRVNNPLTGKPIVIPSANKQVVDMAPEEKTMPVQEDNLEKDIFQESKRGRPKNDMSEEPVLEPVKRGRGRPKKVVAQPEPENNESVNLFEIAEEPEEVDIVEEPVNLFNIPQEDEIERTERYEPEESQELETTNYYQSNNNLETLLSRDKKLVSFVGTTKNGTSFIVNNLAVLLSSMGINTAILDTTRKP